MSSSCCVIFRSTKYASKVVGVASTECFLVNKLRLIKEVQTFGPL